MGLQATESVHLFNTKYAMYIVEHVIMVNAVMAYVVM